ncbi:hypothetical protein [Sinisalibacter lacisalsi]|uniref:Uncharacterized protein n=1 Tax=Sinisalibacter lacisalsi TaxID=1526570 RepID=A0ABQ1QL59_9RHOB|nr:hypothetical protein [Sinisalibacter lacisalsi]GGD29868.1 hypothetical protein GCM10011358_12370 [Sinisalibacter lacisalsi]
MNAIIDTLRADPRLQVEAAIAEAMRRGFSGDHAAARAAMQTTLAASEAYAAHARWCALFLARLGAGGEAEAILASQSARFADAMSTVRPVVDRIARKKAARKAKAAAAARPAGDASGHRGRPFWRRRALTAMRARLLRLAWRLRTRMQRL